MQGIDQTVAVVTGGGTKIGRAAALAFTEAGATVAVAGDDLVGGRDTVAAVTAAGGRAAFYRTDLGSESDWAALVDRVVEAFGSIDHCFVDAEIDPELAPTGGETDDDLDEAVDVEIPGVFYGLTHVAARMKEQETGGSVVSTVDVARIDDDAGGRRRPDALGLAGFHRVAAAAYAPHGVRVNAIQPGVVRSTSLEPLPDGGQLQGRPPHRLAAVQSPPARRADVVEMADPSQIGTAAVWLCSDAAARVTGYRMALHPDDPVE